MITRVRVKNYRNLADVDVRLGPLTVLVGRNGAGKSTFLDVLRFVRDALRSNLEFAIQQRGGIAALRRWQPAGAPTDIEISLTLEAPNLAGEYSFRISTGADGQYRLAREYYSASVFQMLDETGKPKVETFETVPGSETVQGTFINAIGPYLEIDAALRQTINIKAPAEAVNAPGALSLAALSILSPIMAGFRRHLLNVNAYNIYPNTLGVPQQPTVEKTLTEDGRNLGAVLRSLQRNVADYAEVKAALRQTVGVMDFRVSQLGNYLVTELQSDQGGGEAAWFDLSQSSDGTLRMLAILAALYQSGDHTLIAVEEPELALYPGALGVLSDVLHEASQRAQILITTQSPDLISRFSADELRIVERKDGVAQIGQIEERQREVINEQLFSAGDLLRIEGLHRREASEVVT